MCLPPQRGETPRSFFVSRKGFLQLPNQSGPTTTAGKAAFSRNAKPSASISLRPPAYRLRPGPHLPTPRQRRLERAAVPEIGIRAHGIRRRRRSPRPSRYHEDGRPLSSAGPAPAENQQPQSNQQSAKRNANHAAGDGRTPPRRFVTSRRIVTTIPA